MRGKDERDGDVTPTGHQSTCRLGLPVHRASRLLSPELQARAGRAECKAALVSLSQIPVFRSARQIFLENVKDGFRLFGHWIGGCGRRHPSMLDHNQRFVEAPVQSLVWWQESIGTLVGG